MGEHTRAVAYASKGERLMSSSHLEARFLAMWESSYPTIPLDREVILVPKRRYRFDFAHGPSKVAIEINGGTFMRKPTGHTSGTKLDRDYTKYNLALNHGWLVFLLSSKMLTKDWTELIHENITKRL